MNTRSVNIPGIVKEAIKAGFKPDETSDAYLVYMHDKAASDRECWVVHTIADFDREQAYMRGWCVDPKTGQFVVRLSGQTAAKQPGPCHHLLCAFPETIPKVA